MADCVSKKKVKLTTYSMSRRGLNLGKGVMVAATQQHVGKTSTSLGLMSGLLKRFDKVGFCKPVGQKWLEYEGEKVDKDVPLFSHNFGLTASGSLMSPVIVPRGFTKDYIDGKVDMEEQKKTMIESYKTLEAQNDYMVVEGTGHTGVGSIFDLNNTQVAAHLKLDMVLVANGGLGNTIDQLELNRQMCLAHDVPIRGIIINKVNPEKQEMVREYLEKALKKWDVPLVGFVPYGKYLDSPCMLDFERLFDERLLSGHDQRLNHFTRFEMITTGLPHFARKLERLLEEDDDDESRCCWVTHCTRSDIVLGYLSFVNKTLASGKPYRGGLILTGSSTDIGDASFRWVLDHIKHAQVPILNVKATTYEVMHALENYTAKLNNTDDKRSKKVVRHYEQYIDFDALLAGEQVPGCY